MKICVEPTVWAIFGDTECCSFFIASVEYSIYNQALAGAAKCILNIH
jgi:hypothetical protein